MTATNPTFLFAQVNSVSTHNNGNNHTLADNKQPAPPSLGLSGHGITGGKPADNIAANTSFNRPVPSRETTLV